MNNPEQILIIINSKIMHLIKIFNILKNNKYKIDKYNNKSLQRIIMITNQKMNKKLTILKNKKT